ncbi:MAG: T9SS type A sorting domain-containing protein [Bacteroidales bacterium]
MMLDKKISQKIFLLIIIIMSNLKSTEMKKNYFFAALLVFAIAGKLNAQYDTIQLEDKRPVFHLLFNEFIDDYFRNIGSEEHTFVIHSGETITEDQGDQIRGHNWSGIGSLKDFTRSEVVVSSDNFGQELFLPTIFWDSYLSLNPRPQGVGAYSDSHGAYMGPAYTSARTICFFVNVSDSARDARPNGAWDFPMFYSWGNNEIAGQRLHWYCYPDSMELGISWGKGVWSRTTEDAFLKNEWVHLGLTIPAEGTVADAKLYINGIPTDLVTPDTSLNVEINTTPQAAWDGIRLGCMVNLSMADYRVYDVELTENEMRNLIGLNNVSVQSFDHQDLFNIYPVPNNGIFTVEVTEPGVNHVVIRNVLGMVVHDQTVEQKEVMDVSNLPVGMYFVSLYDSNKKVQTRKFLIQ